MAREVPAPRRAPGQEDVGPASTDRGRPAAGYSTKRTAEAWLGDVLAEARAGTLPGMVRTGVTSAEACEEWLRYMEHDLDRKPSTLVQYRSSVRAHFVPAFGVCGSRTSPPSGSRKASLRMSDRTKHKLLAELNGIFVRARRAYKLPANPVADVE